MGQRRRLPNTELAGTQRKSLKVTERKTGTRGTSSRIRRIISEMQKGKKRKSDGELAKDLKKMKEGLKQDLKNLGKEIAQLSNIVENQENLMDDLSHQLKELGYEELEQLNEKFAILCPGPNWDVYMSETEEPVDIISLLKYRSQMLDRRIQLLYEMYLVFEQYARNQRGRSSGPASPEDP
ncbi:hypothetical protein OIU79_008907 [Salix purpurea]|uniref:Uncharacterized protein n=1 Tax=Salix purpurea TaxID=77065 RepID=A0A9Q0TJG9_SALPP|nr:hypothetical protein OIU79_008907 [Salix purpurea]